MLIDTTIRLMRDRGVEGRLFSVEDVHGKRRTPLRYIFNRAAADALVRIIGSFDPDVVHLHNFYHELSPAILGALNAARRRRVVMTAHDYHLVCPNSGLCQYVGGRMEPADPDRLGRISYILSRRWDHRGWSWSLLKLLQHFWHYRLQDHRGVIDLLICPSRYMQRALEGPGLPTVFLPHPAPVPAARVEKPGDELRWVFAGRVEPEKGLVEFLRILPRDFPGRLTIIGEGSEHQRCRAACRQRGFDDRVRFIGRRPRSETLKIIAASHVAVLPSLCPENAPMSLAEALSVGTNILASDRGGMREIVQASGTGFLFAPGDAPSLLRAVDEIDRRLADGTLNAFDASSFLERRSESAYLDGMMRAYRGDLVAEGEVQRS